MKVTIERDRLKAMRNRIPYARRQRIADNLHITYANLNNYLHGKSKMPVDVLDEIIKTIELEEKAVAMSVRKLNQAKKIKASELRLKKLGI
jgi:predicted transcriptional regulator